MEQQQGDLLQPTQWYVLSANYRKEIEVRDELRSRGYEAYVPMRYAMTTVGGRRQRTLQPAIHELVFVRATKEELLDYKHTSRNNPYVFFRSIRRGAFWEPIVVRDADMRNFMRLTTIADADLTYYRPEELRIEPGQQVRIMDGVFRDVVGTVRRLPRRRGDFLVVEIPGVTVVAARIRVGYVQPLGNKIAPSHDIPGDARRMGDLACRLLYDLPATEDNAPVRGGMVFELRSIRQSLDEAKTPMVADRVELALARFLAALALDEDTSEYLAVMRSDGRRLRTSSMLRLRVAMYLALCDEDPEAARYTDEMMARLADAPGTDNRRHLMTEYRHAKQHFRSDNVEKAGRNGKDR